MKNLRKNISVVLTLAMAAAVCSSCTNEPGIEVPDGYTLVWHDEFDGDTLSEDNWSMDFRRAGWVNNELQVYRPDPENIFIEDGDLVIQPIRTVNDQGNYEYTSGRISSLRHQSFRYGRIEARIRVPQGQGFLPAFWMMPENESYGGWPKSGEIDIMEVLGSDTDTLYGTIHYGDPHRQSQGVYDLPEGDFATEYHIFAVDWEPGLISWYIDGELYYQTDYWYSADAVRTRDYPAPFDQEFYIILNVAVGGVWPGDPAEDTPFDERGQMRVDYVRVFQRDAYDENVTAPEPTFDIRLSDETGNYIIDDRWEFLTNAQGAGEAQFEDGEACIVTYDAGTGDYSLQLVQAQLPMVQNAHYILSFDAYADEERTMNVGVSAPDHNYARYMEDETVDLGTTLQHYEFEFDMTEVSDENGRVEFNLGGTDSEATVYISNVRLVWG